MGELIPAWIVAVSLLYTGFIWIVTKKVEIRMDSGIWGWTFVMVGLLYFLAIGDINGVGEYHRRLNGSRLMMLVLSMSQWLPVTISYIRQVRRGKHRLDSGDDISNNSN